MRKTLKTLTLAILALVAIFFTAKFVRSLTVGDEISQLQTNHFLIHYQGIYESEAREIGDELEAKYESIRTELKDPAHGEIKVFIHPDHQSFNKATGLFKSSAIGTSRGPLEFHFIWTNWFNSIFPNEPKKTAIHEFTHCVQLNILITDALQTLDYADDASFNEAFEKQFLEKYPQWFWEAISVYEARELNRISVMYGMSHHLTLQKLSSSSQIYNVGYTLIEYLVDKWGKDQLPEFTRSYCDFEKVLGVSEAEFEQGWRKYVDDHY